VTAELDRYRGTSARLSGRDYSQAGAYFVTTCTRDREVWFGNVQEGRVILEPPGEVVKAVWESLPGRFAGLEVGDFVVMPNHVHGIVVLVGAQFIAPNSAAGRRPFLGEVVRTFKAASTRLIRDAGGTGFGWQPGYYDHVVRDGAEMTRIRSYIRANPVHWDEDELHPAGR
jgi:REP element-mobilizing transposase RayT